MNILCKLARISRSGYYKWLKYVLEPDKDYRDYLTIKEIFEKSKGQYGWRSVKMRLPQMNHKKIQRIMRKYGLVAQVRRRNPYKAIMKKRMEHWVFPNKLRRMFDQTIPFTVFCTDITYIPFHMKDELDYKSCKTFEELRLKAEEYMRYYNCERKQWTRNKMSPVEYREYLLTKSSVGVGFQNVH